MEKEVEEICKWRKNSWGIYVPQGGFCLKLGNESSI